MARRISEELISEICGENDIIDYVSQYVQLKKSGRDYSGLCPFHHEKTPSFHVSQDKQLFHCFGCGASGNLVQFVMRTENLDFVDSVRLLADRAGIIVPEEEEISTAEHSRKQKILEMNKLAARFFHSMLKDKKKGNSAQQYFVKRRISWKTVVVYGLGYAPSEKTALTDYMKGKGYTERQLLDAGLSIERNGSVIDKFRDRVMFPIINVRGDVIGFGGRIMHDNKEINGYKIPKYLNSSETPVFDKGKNLFSLNLAKNARRTELILCEGYMDVISVYQAGVTNIVATLGTAITPNQAKLMMRYANEIVICYDTDEAGTKAAVRAIDVINEAGGRSRVIRLKGAKDPDEYINKNGVEKFKEAVKKSVPSTEFRISLIKSKYDITATDGKVRFLDEAVNVLTSIKDPVEVDAYMNKISDETDINKQAILSKYREKTSKSQYPRRIPPRTEYKRPQATLKDTDGVKIPRAVTEAEKRLLSLLAGSKKHYTAAKDIIAPEDFSTDIHKRLAKKIYECYDEDKRPEEAIILNDFCSTDAEINEASAVFYNMEVYSGGNAVVYDLIYTIKLNRIQMMIDKETDAKRLQELFFERQKIAEQKNQWEEK